jgi:hypothetical protein
MLPGADQVAVAAGGGAQLRLGVHPQLPRPRHQPEQLRADTRAAGAGLRVQPLQLPDVGCDARWPTEGMQPAQLSVARTYFSLGQERVADLDAFVLLARIEVL